MALPLAMAGTQWRRHRYAHATSLWHMPSTVRKGYTHMRHNDLRDSFANLLSDICHDEIERHLQPLQRETIALKSTTTDDHARLKSRLTEFGNRGSTKPILMWQILSRWQNVALKAETKQTSTMNPLKRTNMNKKKQVEKATFFTLVSACTRGAGPSPSNALKQLASKLSAWKEDSYLRTKSSFALLSSSNFCVPWNCRCFNGSCCWSKRERKKEKINFSYS